jgi:hypothetical protein
MYSPHAGGKGIGIMTPVQLDRLFYLLGSLREGILSKPEFAELNRILETDSEGRDYYVDYMYLCADLCNLQAATSHNSLFWNALQEGAGEADLVRSGGASVLFETMKLLGEDEKKAEVISLPRKKGEAEEEVKNIFVQNTPRKVNKASFYTAFLLLAALFVMIVYVYLNPRYSLEVATVADSIDAQWTSWLPLNKDARLVVEPEPIKLQKGVVKLVTDEGVQVLIESPAEFRFISASQIVMNYGRLFATVSQAGRGFTVQTPNSRVIDLGTEFGVLAEMQGAMELHVFKGKIVFIGQTQDKIDVITGQALRLDGSGKYVRSIALNDSAFVRSIDSQSGLLWRGHKPINLADIVGGGDGFNSGRANKGIDPQTGNFGFINPRTGNFGLIEVKDQKAGNGYVRVPYSEFIDGVFVPDGHTKQIISSAGHRFAECPPTSGSFYSFIVNSPNSVNCAKEKNGLPLFLNNVNYSDPQNPCIYLHSNLGITFDLNASRSRLSKAKITQFQTDVGVSDTTPGSFNVDIWVLIDGQVRYKKTGITQKGLLDSLRIDIRDQDRFLTLITTEGENTEDNSIYSRPSTGYDWVVFGRPVLKLE